MTIISIIGGNEHRLKPHHPMTSARITVLDPARLGVNPLTMEAKLVKSGVKGAVETVCCCCPCCWPCVMGMCAFC